MFFFVLRPTRPWPRLPAPRPRAPTSQPPRAVRTASQTPSAPCVREHGQAATAAMALPSPREPLQYSRTSSASQAPQEAISTCLSPANPLLRVISFIVRQKQFATHLPIRVRRGCVLLPARCCCGTKAAATVRSESDIFLYQADVCNATTVINISYPSTHFYRTTGFFILFW